MRHETLQFEPVRRSLYTADELYEGFDPAAASSWELTRDFHIYTEFLAAGGSHPGDSYTAMLRAMHDSSMTQLTADLIAGERVVAIMGGHRVARDSSEFATIAALARRLAHDGLLVTTGGGPGAMEAAHLGARFAEESDDRMREALRLLATEPALPAGIGEIVRDDGAVDAALAEQAHRWFTPAFELHRALPHGRASLAVPTWHYGHEPSTPLASRIGKLFQNSIREDGLLAIATHGVVYAPGMAGTLQEVFQDAAQNYYESYGDRSSPMVLLGRDYWTERFPVVPVLKALFASRYDEIVCITDDIDTAADFIEAATPIPSTLETRAPATASDQY